MYTTSIVPPLVVTPEESASFFDRVFQDGSSSVPDVRLSRRPSATYVFLKDSEGVTVGGAFVQFTFDVVAIDVLWLSREVRGQGHGSRLYRVIEELSVQRGMRRAVVSTFEFQGAIGFWNKMGFVKFGEIDDYPQGSRLLYLHKPFTVADSK